MFTPLVNGPSVRSAAPAPGEALLERYRLDRQTSRNDAAALYEATEIATGRRVTVELADGAEEEVRRCFRQSAALAQRLEGEHVLRVISAGELEDGTPYVVREPSLGTLASDIRARGPLPTTEAVAWTLETCEALAEAHARGMAHGDVRAETIHVARDAAGNPIAKVSWTGNASRAERATREDIVRDVRGAAMLLRFLVTGQAETEQDGAKTLPTGLGHAIARALSPNPENAFRNIGQLASALAPHAPPGHEAARNTASLLSRAGIIGSSITVSASSEPRAISPARLELVTDQAPPSAPGREDSSRPSLPSSPGLNEEWFETRTSRPSLGGHPAETRRSGAFAAVTFFLLAATVIATMLLWRTGRLPQWSAVAPAETVGPAPPPETGGTDTVSQTTLSAAELVEPTTAPPPTAIPRPEPTVPTATRRATKTAGPAVDASAGAPRETSPAGVDDATPDVEDAPTETAPSETSPSEGTPRFPAPTPTPTPTPLTPPPSGLGWQPADPGF